jgi:cell division protease FtsH
MGGRVAEEQVFGYDKVTSGASGDIKMATGLSKAMVTQWGMSDKLGLIAYDGNQEEVFLGHSVAKQQNVSGDTQKIIDEEIKVLVDMGYDKAKSILTEFADQLEIIAQGLLEYETLSGDEIKALLEGKVPERESDEDASPPSRGSAVPTAGASKKSDDGGPGLEPQPET